MVQLRPALTAVAVATLLSLAARTSLGAEDAAMGMGMRGSPTKAQTTTSLLKCDSSTTSQPQQECGILWRKGNCVWRELKYVAKHKEEITMGTGKEMEEGES